MIQKWSRILTKLENEKIISQLVGVSWVCEQCGDRVSKNDKSYHIWSTSLNECLVRKWKLCDSAHRCQETRDRINNFWKEMNKIVNSISNNSFSAANNFPEHIHSRPAGNPGPLTLWAPSWAWTTQSSLSLTLNAPTSAGRRTKKIGSTVSQMH